ncbi:Fic/DOC family protein [Xanthomonas vesicatoria]|uniref:Fic/DOC family protein n=1 Tax=Xanthomonas vesicatoria TaxID=56460 RepID=UPI001E455253|nr:Fic family protein [Xanthomonas vesicatoria]MCC8616306.1 Fic family protein [Xanthomonas vesicatoria]MCC8629158.1 Fic family protein [Xanthomonas vesicatoria]
MAAKYDTPSDPYVDPTTGIMRNSVGARTQPDLDRIEAAFASVRAYELEKGPAVGRYDLDHLRSIHRSLFSDVYPWAGEIRSVVIEKGETRFAMPEHIEGAGAQLFRQLAREQNLRGLGADEFASRAGHYLGEINALHPFREGNGRAQRAFIGQLASDAGYAIAWDRVSRDDMTRASIEAYHSTPDRLSQLIRDNLTDRDHARAVELGRSLAGAGASVGYAELGQTYTGRVLGATERYVVQERADLPGELVLHNRYRVVGDLEAQRGQAVEIRYPQGDVALVMPAKAHDGPAKEKASPDKGSDFGRDFGR